VSAALGTPFIFWQEHVAAVALEVDPATGLLYYRTVILTVPRQSGKTKLELGVAVHRCTAWARQVVTYTAQTRVKAREKWEDDHVKTLDASPFRKRDMFRVRRTTGMEAVLWGNGSKYGIESVTEKSGHGDTLDLGFIDEAFAQVDARTEQAMKPAMMTRPQPQLWIVSTAGTDASVYLREKVNLGRARCDAGLTGGVAYFEWSAPDKADPADPATWRACMPGLAGGLTTEEAVAADFASMDLREFRRGYLNQWQDAIPDEWLVVPREIWEGLRADHVAHGRVALAADMTPKHRAGTIAAAWRRPDGNMDVEVIDHRPGTSWMPGRIAELAQRHRPLAVVIDNAGPAHSLVDDLAARGVEVTCPNVSEVTDGCGRFLDAVLDSRTVRHSGDPVLDAAVAGAVRRDLGDRWAWARKAPVIDISPLVAVTLAFWAHDKFADRKAPYDLLRSVG
jgi:phage terminase large subunit-like protein